MIAGRPLHADVRDVVKAGVLFLAAERLVQWPLDAADLVEKSEAEGRKASPRIQVESLPH